MYNIQVASLFFALGIIPTCVNDGRADVILPAVFANHMVLQREHAIPIWGSAEPGEKITVLLGDDQARTVADAGGRWSVRMRPRPASHKPVELTIRGSNTVRISDVLVGDVWLCSGQSNMHWPLKLAEGGETEISKAADPGLRLLNFVARPYTHGRHFDASELKLCQPEKYLSGRWAVCSSESTVDFSAVGYFFGRAMREHLQVPIGLIHNAVGGTPTEAWISRDSLAADPALRGILQANWLENPSIHPFCRSRAIMNMPDLKQELFRAKRVYHHPYEPGFMHTAGIAPLAPFCIRGVIWYQGESNTHSARLHDVLFPTIVKEWRDLWHQGDFPFLFVQLPNKNSADDWPAFRQSQLNASRLTQTGMAVTIDIGDPADVHPRDKREVGRRLSLLARRIAHNSPIESSGPVFHSAARIGRELHLEFAHAGDRLQVKGKPGLSGFEIRGLDGLYIPVQARIRERSVIITLPGPDKPTGIRWAHASNPPSHLLNSEGLPASPFEVDLD
jgi:sialate O-acetylesterase